MMIQMTSSLVVAILIHSISAQDTGSSNSAWQPIIQNGYNAPNTEFGPDTKSVVSGDFWKPNISFSSYFHVDNIFSHNKEELGFEGYWLAPTQSIASFIINLGCQQNIGALKLVNTHNQHLRDRSTKEFRLSLSMKESGPWTKVLEKSLDDSRQQPDPLPVQVFPLERGTEDLLPFQEESFVAQYLKFDLLDWYGLGGGLQYLEIQNEREGVRVSTGPLSDVCKCINPWEGQRFNQHSGDPDNTCPTFCYVSCNSDCSDKKPAKGKGRCYSEIACNPDIPLLTAEES